MLSANNLSVHYGDMAAVAGVDIHVDEQTVLAVVGPSGCGKSTLLRAIAGLERLTTGRIAIDGEDVHAAPPHLRRVGMMFQEHALFPHRTVADNVAFGLRMQGIAPRAISARVTQVLQLVDLDGTQDRAVTTLSGGQQQRVALARAIAPRPRVLLLDEPLGSLDRPLQRHLLAELPDLLRQVGTATIYVTHDQDEALHLADTVAVMDRGRFVQVATPQQVVRSPATAFVARFVGAASLLAATIDHGRAVSSLAEADISPDRRSQTAGSPAWIVVRADALTVVRRVPGSHDDQLASSDHAVSHEGIVRDVRWLTDRCLLRVAIKEFEFAVPWWDDQPPEAGELVDVLIDQQRLTVVYDDGPPTAR